MLTANELKEKLLRFTRDRLASPDVAGVITADTRLFEDRIIDSLKVLELIAFVQSAVGRKIPDSQIVLANFRTIATIARVFTGAEPADTRRRLRRRPAPSALAASSPVADMRARGDLQLSPEGALHLRGDAAVLLDYFDSTVRGWAEDLGATNEIFPDDIALSTLDRAGFLSAFPDKLVRHEDKARSPAVCYHRYPSLANRAVQSPGSIVTAIGRCHRNEFDAGSKHPEERLASFTMREIIAVGGAEFVEDFRTTLLERTRLWVKELGLNGQIITANDPFFTTESRGRAVMQQLLPLKYELQLRAGNDGRTIAAASFNNHHQHFARAFSIRLASGELATSGCVAFGWERWVIAFVNQYGSSSDNWPEIIRGRDVALV